MLLCAELLVTGRSEEGRRRGAVSGSGININLPGIYLRAMQITGGSLRTMGSCNVDHHRLRPALS